MVDLLGPPVGNGGSDDMTSPADLAGTDSAAPPIDLGIDGSVAGGPGGLGGNATVAGGDRSRSPHYLLIHTLGQPTQNQQKTVSPGYQMQGGLSGASGR